MQREIVLAEQFFAEKRATEVTNFFFTILIPNSLEGTPARNCTLGNLGCRNHWSIFDILWNENDEQVCRSSGRSFHHGKFLSKFEVNLILACGISCRNVYSRF
jgi:hypothetical protein